MGLIKKIISLVLSVVISFLSFVGCYEDSSSKASILSALGAPDTVQELSVLNEVAEAGVAYLEDKDEEKYSQEMERLQKETEEAIGEEVAISDGVMAVGYNTDNFVYDTGSEKEAAEEALDNLIAWYPDAGEDAVYYGMAQGKITTDQGVTLYVIFVYFLK